MALAKALGHKRLHRLADQLAARVSEQRLRLLVNEHDLPVGIDPDDRVGGKLDELFELALRSTTGGHVPDRRRGKPPALGFDRRQ
jgi:hypothetical protein